MKRNVSRLRLSPNEEAQLIREEHERRRKLRIQQVREQERYIALQIRTEVQLRRERELQNLAEELKGEWEQQQSEKLKTLQKLYQDNLRVLGEGHRSAKENEPDWEAIAQKNEENHVRADERYRVALKELKSQRQKDQEEQNRFIKARKKSIQVEKQRAAKVANFPSLPPNPIESIESRKLHAVKKSDVDAFSVTHYHMPETAVDREVYTAQPNAQVAALEEMQRLQELGQEEQSERREQLEKARLRGNHALRREQLTQDRARLLVELEHMHQTDLLRRRQVMAQMPAQIFQPLHKRQEMREDWQRDMEFAFEDMYTGERRVKGDLVLQLVPEPLLAVSTGSQDEDLDLTQEATPDLTPLAGAEEQQDEEPSRPLGGAPRQALKKLLTRIRSQRDQWSYRRLADPPGDCQTTPTAECDTSAGITTIETGSLASEERGRPLTTISRLPDPSQSAQAIETTEESIVAGTLLHPDKQVIKIHTFETERKRREEELERQKQEQIALLQELEEKKSRLELLLQEAQQEREQLQTAMNQDTPAASGTQKTPAQDVSPAAPTPESTIHSAAEDDHSRRIREYQQRLFDQNRLHKQSVEEARRRLEGYQRTLRNRYSGQTSSTCLPPGTTARPLPHFKGLINPPAVPLELPSGSALLPCLPVALSPYSRAHTPLDLPTQEPSILAQTLFLPGTTVGSHINSRTSPVQLEPTFESLRDQRAGVWLAENVFSRVTEDVPEKLPPPSTSLDPQSYRPRPVSLHPTPHIPLPSRTDPIPPISPTLSEVGAPVNPGEAPVNPGSVLRAPDKFGEEVERQRQELREAQRRVEAQREVLFMQQRELEEEQREQRRRQREALQALLTADDTQPDPETTDGLGSEVLGSERLRLMAALLRAIEESNGQTSTSVETSQSQDDTLYVQSSHSDRPAPHPLPHPRAAKPPVARARLAVMEMTEQHELSAIQEVETPANASLITEESVAVSIERAIAEEQDHSGHSERGHSSTSVSSAWEHTAGTGSETLTGSGRSSKLSWRERLQLEAGASPGPDPTTALPERSYHSCQFGRGVLGKSPTELESLSFQSACRPSEPDYLSSTTISSGSYATTDPEHTSTDPEHTSTQIDSSLLMAGFGMGGGGTNKKTSVNGSSSSRHSPCRGVSGTILDSLIHSSSIQRIIDKYTRELNFSLSTAGNQTGPSAVLEGSVCEEPSSSVSQQKPWSKLLQENEGPDRSPVWESGAQGQDQEWDNTVNRIMDRLSDKSSSLVLDQGRDSTFSPMTGQPSDKSSSPGQGWDSTLSRMIGQLSGQSTSLDHGWDSTLSRMIGGLSNQSISVSQRLDQSSQWLDEVQDESRVMRPLAGELDESAAQWSGSSEAGGSNSLGWVDLRVSGQTGVFSDPEGAPESQLLSSSSLPGREPPHYQSLQHSGACSKEADRTGASDSFHPLLAEVTHNETAEPFMTFHLPEEEVEGLCSHDEDGDHEAPAGDLELSACSEEFEDDTDPSVTSEPSPERLRGAEEPPQPSPALHDSLYQLTISQCLPHDSALQVSPGAEEVGLAACEDVSTLDMPLEGGDTDMESTPTPQRLDKRGAIKIEDLDAGEPDDQLCSESKISPPIWERIMEVGSVKGIMNESMLTLVSLTDTTLQGQELTEEGEIEESKSTMLPEEDASLQEKETTPSHAVMLLEFQSCPSVNLQEAFQQKRRALIQRSARRVEEIQAKRDEARANTITRAQSDITESRANTTTRAQSDISESRANTTTRAQSDPTTVQSTASKPRREERSAESTHAGGYAKQKKQQPKPQTPLQPPMLAKLKKVGEVRISTPEIRKQDVAEMHKRTERLYSRLDEVKLQKEVRSRQVAYANNREKAKEFHKKTLQKLRAKQSSQ